MPTELIIRKDNELESKKKLDNQTPRSWSDWYKHFALKDGAPILTSRQRHEALYNFYTNSSTSTATSNTNEQTWTIREYNFDHPSAIATAVLENSVPDPNERITITGTEEAIRRHNSNE